MTATAVAKLVEPSTPLERLLSDQAGLADQLARLTAVSARLQTEAMAGDALSADLDRLAAVETSDMRSWAAGGCVGSPPKGKQSERQAIAVKMASVIATAAAAHGAIADVDQQVSAINDQLRTIAAEIEQKIFDQLEHEHSAIIDQYRHHIEEAVRLAAKIHGLANFFGETGRNLIAQRGDQAGGVLYLQRASALTQIKLPSPSVSRAEIEMEAVNWSRRAATLRSGVAS